MHTTLKTIQTLETPHGTIRVHEGNVAEKGPHARFRYYLSLDGKFRPCNICPDGGLWLGDTKAEALRDATTLQTRLVAITRRRQTAQMVFLNAVPGLHH